MLGQSKHASRKAGEYAALLLAAYNEARGKVEKLRQSVLSNLGDQELEDQLAEAVGNSDCLYKTYCHKRSTLGVDGRLSLQKLEGDQYLQLCINGQILKR